MPPAPLLNTAGVPVSQASGSPVPVAPTVPTQPTAEQLAARTAASSGTTAPAKPATPPAVLSSSTIADEVIPANTAKLADLSKKGTYVAGDGNTYYSDGSLVAAPMGAEYNPNAGTGGAWVLGGQQYGAAPQFVTGDDEEAKKTNELFASMKMSLDSQTLSQVNNIQQQYDILRSQQQDANSRADSTRQRSLLVGGGARYAPLASAGITLAQTSFGLQQIQKLDADENAAIASARAAQESGDMKLMDSALSIVADTRKAKQEAAAKIADQLSKANADVLAHNKQVARDESVAQFLAAGVTDPTAIFNALRAGGVDITADDVSKVIAGLVPKTADNAVYKFSNTDVGKLLSVGINADEIHALSDYYNGNPKPETAGILQNLSSDQQAAVYKVLGGKAADDGSTPAGPTWDEYLKEVQDQLGMELNPGSDLYKQAQSDYAQIRNVSLGTLTPTEKNTLTRAGLTGAPNAVKSYFLSTQPAFQDEFTRSALAGTADTTLEGVHKAYDDWTAQNSTGSDAKIQALIKALAQ